MYSQRCPSCQHSMIKMTDQEGRVWLKCPACGVQIPESGYREVKVRGNIKAL